MTRSYVIVSWAIRILSITYECVCVCVCVCVREDGLGNRYVMMSWGNLDITLHIKHHLQTHTHTSTYTRTAY